MFSPYVDKYNSDRRGLLNSLGEPVPHMRKVILIFPDVTSIAEFILTCKVSRVIIDSSEKMLRGIISDAHLRIACKDFGAKVKESIQVKSFSS
jgi:hypothetical protein